MEQKRRITGFSLSRFEQWLALRAEREAAYYRDEIGPFPYIGQRKRVCHCPLSTFLTTLVRPVKFYDFMVYVEREEINVRLLSQRDAYKNYYSHTIKMPMWASDFVRRIDLAGSEYENVLPSEALAALQETKQCLKRQSRIKKSQRAITVHAEDDAPL